MEELLFYISPDLASVCGQMDPSTSKTLYSIHLKCHCLVSGLLVVGCPLEVIYKVSACYTYNTSLSNLQLLLGILELQTWPIILQFDGQ